MLDKLNTVQSIRQYVIKEMTARKCGLVEIQEYQNQIKGCDYWTMRQVSQEYLDMLQLLPS